MANDLGGGLAQPPAVEDADQAATDPAPPLASGPSADGGGDGGGVPPTAGVELDSQLQTADAGAGSSGSPPIPKANPSLWIGIGVGGCIALLLASAIEC